MMWKEIPSINLAQLDQVYLTPDNLTIEFDGIEYSTAWKNDTFFRNYVYTYTTTCTNGNRQEGRTHCTPYCLIYMFCESKYVTHLYRQ